MRHPPIQFPTERFDVHVAYQASTDLLHIIFGDKEGVGMRACTFNASERQQLLDALFAVMRETATAHDTTTTTISAEMGGHVGVKDMLFAGVRRLTVRTPGTDGAEGIGSCYLTAEDCRAVATALSAQSLEAAMVEGK